MTFMLDWMSPVQAASDLWQLLAMKRSGQLCAMGPRWDWGYDEESITQSGGYQADYGIRYRLATLTRNGAQVL